MAQEFFTLQVTYNLAGVNETVLFKDLTPEIEHFNLWSTGIRQRLFTTGFQHETAPGTFRMINPLWISDVFLIKQPEGRHGTK